MKVILRNPNREVEIPGGRRVRDLLRELNILPDTVLVIRGKELLTGDTAIGENDQVEVRPVISGGSSSGFGVRGSRFGFHPRKNEHSEATYIGVALR